MRHGHVAHELRIAKPTIRDEQQRSQRHTTSSECRHASIQHDLYPVQFVPTRCPRAGGIGPTDGKVDGHQQFPSPITTTRRTPSMPESTRCSWPLHQVPTSPNCSPYFLNTESSPTQVHCQRLRVPSILLAA